MPSADCSHPPSLPGPQQRAARVTAAFYRAKTLHITDVMRLTQLSRRGANTLLETISGADGIPIYPIGEGRWRLLEPCAPPPPQPTTRPMFKIHPNTRALVVATLAQRDQMSAAEIARAVGLNVTEVRWLLNKMRQGRLPLDEAGPDVWRVRKGG